MGSNWNAAQSGAATSLSFGVGPDSNTNLDWRSQMQPDARQRIVNEMMDTLKRHLPVLVPERLSEFQKIAVRFEEQIFSSATSQPDYLKKITLKMISIERETQPGLNPSLPNQNQIDPGVGMTSQQPGLNPGKSLGMPQVMNQPPASRQQQPLLQGSPNTLTAVTGGASGATITMAGMQMNMSSAQVLRPQQQHQEQQIQPQQRMMPTQQQTQQRYLQQRLMQQKQQLVQQNQMRQLSEPSDPVVLKSQQGASGMKSGSMYEQHYPRMGPCNSYYHSQLKPGSNLPISSPQNIQSSSPQISHQSPQVDQQGLIPPTQLKSGTPLQAAAPPFIPSPSLPVIPSPMIEDTNPSAGLMHNSAAGQAGHPLPANSALTGQMGQPQAESLSVGTPGISASPLPAEFTSPEAGQGTILSIQVPESEKPIEKLARLLRTMPHNQLSAVVKDIASVVSMVDRIAGSAPGNGSQAAIGDNLVAMTKCRLQAKNLAHPEGVAGTSGRASPPTKKMKRDTSAMPHNCNNNDGLSRDAVSFTYNLNASGRDASEMQSTAMSSTS